jgi:PTH1 family peptidyl-tRNA hydrolase
MFVAYAYSVKCSGAGQAVAGDADQVVRLAPPASQVASQPASDEPIGPDDYARRAMLRDLPGATPATRDDAPARRRLVVGLGNPGPEFAATRHNLGFRVVELVAGRTGLPFRRSAWRGAAAVGEAFGQPVVLLKPSTAMNGSGRSVRLAAAALGLGPSDLLVVHDELDLPPGALRLRERGGAGGHNGLRSIMGALRSQEFARLALGVGRPAEGAVDAYLLAAVPPEERADEEAVVARAAEAVELVLRDGLAAARAALARPAPPRA